MEDVGIKAMNWDDMGNKPTDEELQMKRTRKLELNELIQQNINTWGNVQYNIPLRVADNETRTASSIALRHISPIYQNLDCNTYYLLTNQSHSYEIEIMNWDDMGAEPEEERKEPRRRLEKLKLNELLMQNVNTWGNVEYNIPLYINENETRTSSSIALRHIPPIYQNLDCSIKSPLPDRVTGRDMVVNEETFKSTTRSDYCVRPNPNKAMEKCDNAASCRRVNFMTDVQKRMEEETLVARTPMSTAKDSFRGVQRTPTAPPDSIVRPPDPNYIFDVIAYGRGSAPCIPEDAKGFRKLMDPYFTEYRANYRQYNPDEWADMKDHFTYYTETKTPRVKGFGPRYKDIWQPLESRPNRPVQDRLLFKTEYRGVCSAHNPVQNLKRAFISETSMKYKVPFEISALATWSAGEDYSLAPFPPNPYQTNLAPFMYCSEYCHIGRNAPNSVIDQTKHIKPHEPCKQRYIVSTDETMPSAAKPAPIVAKVAI